MNVNTLEARVDPTAPRSRSARASTTTTAPVRPARRTGRGTGPAARPTRRLEAPAVIKSRGSSSQGCSVTAPPATAPRARRPGSAPWRLTERGVALVLVTGLLIAAAALAVVGLTAIRVTGERYHHDGQPALVQPVS